MATRPHPPLVTRHLIQRCLGILWLFDGLLQLQPQMFTTRFATGVIAPAAGGQPTFIAAPIRLFVHLLKLEPALLNAGFGLVQLALGVLILTRPTVRLGLLASSVWALGVWYLGEGSGGLFGGQTSLLMGAPGAALLYAILALAVLPSSDPDDRPAYWLPIVWAGLWVMGALYQLAPGQNTPRELSHLIAGMATGAPHLIRTLDLRLASGLTGAGGWVVGALAATQLTIGLLVLLPGWGRRIALGAGIILSLGFWLYGQGLGTLSSGLATDPGTAPLFILLAIAILGCLPLELEVLWRRSGQDLERLAT